MKKRLVQIASTLLFVTIFFAFVAQPARYTKAFVDGLTIWTNNILPTLFPFALLSTSYTKIQPFDKNRLSKFLFKIACDEILITSILCGYPVGAKVISQQNIDENSATILSSFCSTPSPIFLLVTVGSLIGNTTATIIIFLSQLIAMVLNGWLHSTGNKPNIQLQHQAFDCKDFGDVITNSILALLTVGALIALFFMLGEIFQSLLPTSISTHPALYFAIGLLEMTSGIIKITQSCNIVCSTVCTSALLSFGGLCVTLQCFAFLSQRGVKFANLLKMKCTQCAFATISAFVLAKIFL